MKFKQIEKSKSVKYEFLIEINMKHDSITMNNGYIMPTLGFGTWKISKEEIHTAIEEALEAGYRHIDTAPVYLNEQDIGQVLQKWFGKRRIKRSELFITTKLPPVANRPHQVEQTLLQSLKDLQLEYVDLYLVHTPFTVESEGNHFKYNQQGEVICDITNHVAVWKKMEEMVLKGLTKSIGVSNFNQKQLERLLPKCNIPPAVLQIEFHIFLQQPALVQFCKRANIAVTAYSPFGSSNAENRIDRPIPNFFTVPEVELLSQKYNKKPSQVLLRWIIDNGLCVLPRSTNKTHIRENINVFDFSLAKGEIEKLNSLDANLRIIDFAFIKGIEKHPEFPFKKIA